MMPNHENTSTHANELKAQGLQARMNQGYTKQCIHDQDNTEQSLIMVKQEGKLLGVEPKDTRIVFQTQDACYANMQDYSTSM